MRVRWIIAVVAVLALVVAWVVFADLNHGRVTRCPAGTVRVHENCVQT
jgi:hypothetical protein